MNSNYMDYATNQPMSDGKEMRDFFDDLREEDAKKKRDENLRNHIYSNGGYKYKAIADILKGR